MLHCLQHVSYITVPGLNVVRQKGTTDGIRIRTFTIEIIASILVIWDILFLQKALNVILVPPNLDNDFKRQHSHNATSNEPHRVDRRRRVFQEIESPGHKGCVDEQRPDESDLIKDTMRRLWIAYLSAICCPGQTLRDALNSMDMWTSHTTYLRPYPKPNTFSSPHTFPWGPNQRSIENSSGLGNVPGSRMMDLVDRSV